MMMSSVNFLWGSRGGSGGVGVVKHEPGFRGPTSRSASVLSFVFLYMVVVSVLLRCCDRLTVLELFVLLAEVWRCTERRGASALLALLCLVCHPAMERETAAAGHVAET